MTVISHALNYALNKGFQIHPDALKIIEKIDAKELERVIREIIREKSKHNVFFINQNDLETSLGFNEDKELKNECEVLFDPSLKITSAEGVEGFNKLFASRYSKLKKIILNRPESKMLKPISTILKIKSKDSVYVCGLVSERKTERNITRISIDDPSGNIETIVFDKDLRVIADSLLTDQFVMVRIVVGKNGGFIVKDILMPDIPERVVNRSKTETYAVFLSDLHIGNKYFMSKEWEDFVSWLSSSEPIARKIRFVLIAGDVIDGVGIYPGQEKELDLISVNEQLDKTKELLDKIPKHIKVIIIPGNHDPGRRALPQPAIPKKYNSNLWSDGNICMVGNPSLISLNGVKVLMFHGQSIDDVVKITPGLSYDQPIKAMKCLLRARHLSPIYGSQTPIAPEFEDMMVINQIPDIFHVGHIHIVGLEMYRGVLMINSGTWQHQTPFQTGVGITSTPGIAVIVNLKNFKVYTKDFSSQN